MSSASSPSTPTTPKRKSEDELERVSLEDGDEEEVEEGDWSEEAELETASDDVQVDYNDEPDAEGDEPPKEELEPSEEAFGKMKFFLVCKRLESLCQLSVDSAKKRKKAVPLSNKLAFLLPPKSLEQFTKLQPGERPQTTFPLIRLLCPDKDTSRQFFMKESTMAAAYIAAFGWKRDAKTSQALLNFHNPAKSGHDKADFSLVLQSILEGKDVKPREGCKAGPRIQLEPSSLTVADINEALDELAGMRHRGNQRPSNHDWVAGGGKPPASNKRQKWDPTLARQRARWVERLLFGNRRISPLEHKWLVRIVFSNQMRFGMGHDKILKWLDELAPTLWSGHNSLRGVCRIICQPEFRRQSEAIARVKDIRTLAPYQKMSPTSIQFGRVFTPMFSARTGFQRMLFELSDPHRTFLKDPKSEDSDPDAAYKNLCPMLGLQHPAFTMETKLDGERMLVHLSRDGLVKIHSKQGNWYSDWYSPVLGPAIRRAFGHHKVDLILDGEILAWDDGKHETIPFGNNKTVATFRTRWMRHEGSLDARDRNLHEKEKEAKVIHTNMTWAGSEGVVPDIAGEECWLQFLAFDVVYIEGDRASALLNEAVSPFANATPGMLTHLECFERKKLLYHLIRTQHNEVEVVPTLVVTSTGACFRGEEYFAIDDPPGLRGTAFYNLESPAYMFNALSDKQRWDALKALDEERRNFLDDKEASLARARAVDAHYKKIVEDFRQEGLVFKDLSSPYVLDTVSRSLGYWRKFKPDYFSGSMASDLDLIIVGASFATGLRNSGRPSSFLCACLDEMDEEKFIPLCKVNAGSMSYRELADVLRRTGFVQARDGQSVELGKWFASAESRDDFPEFVSSRVYLEDPNQGGFPTTKWKPKKDDYPDLWIEPDQSVILTLNAGEIIVSTAFPSGITLRFPRITRFRDDKGPRDIEPLSELWKKFTDFMDARTQDTAEGAFEVASPSRLSMAAKPRFFTEEIYLESKRKSRRKKQQTTLATVPTARNPSKLESVAFRGLVFVTLEGNYRLSGSSMDTIEGKEEGWFDEALAIKDPVALQRFIKKHGGSIRISPTASVIEEGALIAGGDSRDTRVRDFALMLQDAKSKFALVRAKKKPTQKDQQTLVYAQCPGVIRWTFLLSALSKWRAAVGDDFLAKSIKETRPDFLVPDFLDYLVRPRAHGENVVDQLCRIPADNLTKMRRLLYEVSQEDEEVAETIAPSTSWQDLATLSLDPTARWIMGCGTQSLWPYREDAVIVQDTVVYPAVFANANCSTNDMATVDKYQFAPLLSVLPLLRVAGAFLATSLTDQVTHILCPLREGLDCVSLESMRPEDFSDHVEGPALWEQVQRSPLYPDKSPDFVSAAWVRK